VFLTAAWLLGLRTGRILDLPSAVAWMAVVGTVCWPLRRWQASAPALGKPERGLVPRAGAPELTLSRSEL
jgi:hypothetical protein